ncbi:MAG: DinB family protein [Promethearchaeota archaeon]
MILKNLGKYHLWAGHKIRTLLEDLNEEEFTRDLGDPVRNVRNICEHIVLALEVCFVVICGDINLLKEKVLYIQNLTTQGLLQRWQVLDNDLASALQSKPRGTVTVGHFPTPFTMNLVDFYFQYVNHTTYHRGQLIIALRMLEKPTVGTDYLMYFDELNKRVSGVSV